MATQHILRENVRSKVQRLLNLFPVTALLGPRQVGKTTLAKNFYPDHIFDLENPRDLILMNNPQLMLEDLEGLIMIDEIQRKSDLFPLMRYLVDENPHQRYLILGSASSNLRQQSGESLAGRIGYYYLSGFHLDEVGSENMSELWVRGGFPRSFLADDDETSVIWRSNFVTTFLEKDLSALGIQIPSSTMFRFWIMLSHYHGQVLNYSELGRSFGISDKTTKQYISILEDTFMVRILMPWFVNTGKRLVKRPKLYIRDSGVFHSLQDIGNMNELKHNPKLGASWEGFALEEVAATLAKKDNELFFYASHGGVELDLLWQQGGKQYGAEFKYSDAPAITRSMLTAVSDLNLAHLWVIYPGNKRYRLSENITVLPLTEVAVLKYK